MSRILIVDADSMLGRHCRDEFERAGWTVLGTATQPEPGSGYVPCSVRNGADVQSVIEILGPDAIVNCASTGYDADPDDLYETHAGGTMHVLSAVAKVRPKTPVLTIGCGSEYGPRVSFPAIETADADPDCFYGASKLAQTQMAKFAARELQLSVISVRPFVLVGPGLDSDSAIARLFARVHDTLTRSPGQTEFDVPGAGAVLDLIDVRDAAKAIRLLIEKGRPEPGRLAVCNIATQMGTRLLDVASILSRHAGLKPRPVKGKPDGWVIQGVGSFARLRNATGWSPEFTWRQSLEEICRAGLAVGEPVA